MGWRVLASVCLCLLLSARSAADAPAALVSSPNGVLRVEVLLDNGTPYYRVMRFGLEVVGRSRLGLSLKNGPVLDGGFVIERGATAEFDETWNPVWGEQQGIRNHYNELRVDLKGADETTGQLTVVVRVFDDGVGLRYEVPAQEGLTHFAIMDELTEFSLSGDHEAWWIPAYQPNRFEYLYRSTPVRAMETAHTPVTFESKDGLFLSIHEADLTDYACMTLAHTGEGRLKADLVPWSDGERVKASAPMKSPWRTIQIADTAGGLITSSLILNLNEPCRLADTSWIEPGKYVGVWWEMHLGKSTWGSGEKHGATTANTKLYIDFAAKHGFSGVLVEGWNKGWDGDWTRNGDQFSFIEPYPDFDIGEVTRYEQERGVRLIGHHETATGIANYERQMEEAFALYQRLGVRAVKTGYVGHGQNVRRIDENGSEQREWHHGQFMVRHYQKVVETAARYQIMLDVHEPIKDTGIRRTWPNMMTREGARGQEYNAWGKDGGNPPEHTLILPFTRMLGGPMDYTPGILAMHYEQYRPDNRINSTLIKELALYVAIYSPLEMAADLPENYAARPDVFQFMVDVPADWRATRVLHARIGDYLTIVRQDRRSDDWYLGSLTDENGRVLEASLSFLEPGRTYEAQIYADGLACDWRSNPYDYVIEKRGVTAADMLTLRLAPGGGQAIRFRALPTESH